MVIKSMRMRCAGHVACKRRREMHTEFWWKKLKEKDHLDDLGTDRKLVLSGMDRDRWQALVKMVMQLNIPLKAGHIMTS
jgi:hypothetical protein